MRLKENGTKRNGSCVVHVDDIFCVELNIRCGKFGMDSNQYVSISILEEVRLCAGIRFSRDLALGMVTLSQQTCAKNLFANFARLHMDGWRDGLNRLWRDGVTILPRPPKKIPPP